MKNIVIIIAGAGVAYFVYKRYLAPSREKTTVNPLAGTILDPSSWVTRPTSSGAVECGEFSMNMNCWEAF